MGYDPQLLLTDERASVQYSAYQQVLAFRAAYPKIVDVYSKFAQAAMSLVPAVGGVVGSLHGRNLQGRDPEMIESIPVVQPVGEFVIGTGRLHFDPPIQRIHRIDRPHIAVFDIETDFSLIEERMLRTLGRKAEIAREQMMMYALGALAHETRFREPVVEEEPTKQNGRSASYLKHDKTKNHRRRKRK